LSDGRSPVLIPFMDRFVGDVDTVAGRIEINERWILDIE
jgi:ribosomal 30S subunit maturation factor RimM